MYLPDHSLLVFNNTRVIHARLLFRTDSGSLVELFLLKPHEPAAYDMALRKTGECIWECMVGNLKKWKQPLLRQSTVYGEKRMEVSAEKYAVIGHAYLIRFSWSDEALSFGEIIERTGLVPLPPYIKRKAVVSDDERYQTVYSLHQGSVAAPTAGLHFTDRVIRDLERKNIIKSNILLHVGAGTFLPVKNDRANDHIMHSEQFTVTIDFLDRLLKYKGAVVAVGTTSVRTLESLYWIGVNLKRTGSFNGLLDQWAPYQTDGNLNLKEALQEVIAYLRNKRMDQLTANTSLMIVPGYKFRVVNQLITNFHQPRSTLLLLVAAFIGDDWKKVYDYALGNDFRFLSYGDSSLLVPGGNNPDLWKTRHHIKT
jgi:S-adenosylmethionine:tRNA ribosyltransferase-isomerase